MGCNYMIKSGLCSVTFRNKTPGEIIDLTARAGDIKAAEEIRIMTEENGLEIPAYGSYYRLGNGQDFKTYWQESEAFSKSTASPLPL